jgi:hypothetical protein
LAENSNPEDCEKLAKNEDPGARLNIYEEERATRMRINKQNEESKGNKRE